MNDGSEPVAGDELLFRRVPMSWFPPLNPDAFAPHKIHDVTGLSRSRAKYKTIEEAAKGQPGKSYFVAVLRAETLQKAQLEIVPRPLAGDPGHAELPDLNAANRKSDRTQEFQRLLVQLTLRVEGPFAQSDQA